MKIIYDLLLNFSDSDNLIEYYEWNKEDNIDNIKEIPIFRISTEMLNDIINNKIKIEDQFINKIENKTTTFSNEEFLYACLVTDLNKVIALELSSNGEVINRSTLLDDEEEDTIDESFELIEEQIKYEIIRKYNIQLLTRKQLNNKNFLLHELDYIYENNLSEQLNYLYGELFKYDKTSIKNKYLKIKDKLITNYSDKENKLAELLKLSYIKK